MTNSNQLQFGDLSVNGNSDFIQEYETAAIFQANEHTAVGLNNSTIQLFSATTDNEMVQSIFGFELPNQQNDNSSQLNKTFITNTDPVLKNVPIAGFDVVQNPATFLNDNPQTHLIAYSQNQGGLRQIYFKSDPLSPSSENAYAAIKIKEQDDQLPPINAIKGFYPCYPAAYCDRLNGEGSGLAEIYVQDENANQQSFQLSNSSFLLDQDFFASGILDFDYSYYQNNEQSTTDYLLLAFILKVQPQSGNQAMKNVLYLMAYNRKDGANLSPVSYLVELDTNFNPTALTSRQDDKGFPQLYLAGNLDGGGYACYQLNYDYDPQKNDLSANIVKQFTTSIGTLTDFNIGEVIKNDTSSLEFWGEVNLPDQKGTMLMNALCENGQWTQPFPIRSISRYLYLCDRVTGISSIFVCPEDSTGKTSNDMIHYWIDPVAKSLNSQSVCLPDSEVRPFKASATYLNFTLSNPHTQSYPIKFSLASSNVTYVKVNGQPHCLSPDNPATVQTDNKGRLKIIREVNGVEGEEFYIKYSGATEYLKVDTRANAQGYLATRKLSDKSTDLDQANKQLSANISSKNGGKDLITMSLASSITPDKNQLSATNASSGTFVAYTFLPTGVHISSSQEEFSALKLSQAGKPKLVGESFLDELFDAFKSAWEDLKHDVSKFCAAAENFLGKVTSIVIDVGKMTIHFAEDVAEVFLDTVEDIWKAIKFVFNALKDIVEDIIDFLGALWDILKSIKPTAQALNQIITISLKQLSNDLTSDSMKRNVANFIADLTGQMPNSVTTDNTNAKTSDQGSNIHHSFFGSSAINWIISHIEDMLSSGDSGGIEINLADDALVFAEDAVKTVTDAIEGIFNIITNLDDFNNQVNMLSSKLNGDVQTVLKDLDQLILDLFEAIAQALAAIMKALTDEINIPIISELYAYLVGDQLTVSSLVSMVLAIPTAVIYGVFQAIDSGDVETPFERLDLSNVESFNDLITTLFGSNTGSQITSLLPFLPENIFSQTNSVENVKLVGEGNSDSEDLAKEIGKCLGIAGLANSILSYLLFALNEASESEDAPGPYQRGFKIGGFVLLCINSFYGLAMSETKDEKAVNGYLSAMKIVKGLLGFISAKKGSNDKAMLTGIQGMFAVLCFGAYIFSDEKAKDTLKIIHPTIDFIGDFALEKKEFPVSLLIEVIAWVITATELYED